MQLTITAMTLSLLLSSTALAQEQEKPKDDTMRKAGTIATQPARDIGIDKDEIPAVLTKAVDNPYAPPPSRTCKGLNTGLGELNAVLGDVRGSLKKVDAVLVEAQAVGANAKDATHQLGDLRADVEANLRKVEGMLTELNRKWPFAKKDAEVRLP